MKRDDGVNRTMPVNTIGFARDNPGRIAVSKYKGMWRIFRGTERLGGYGTFQKALAMANAYSRGSQS